MSNSKLAKQLADIVREPDPDKRSAMVSKLASADGVEPEALWAAAAEHDSSSELLARGQRGQIDTVNDTIVERWAEDREDIAVPKSVAELVALLRRALEEGVSVRAVGSARSLSDAPAPTDDAIMLNTGGLGDVIPLDASLLRDPAGAASLYQCGAGRTVEAVLGDLDPHRRNPRAAMAHTLENLGAGQFQTVVGALSTSTHGSGLTKPSFPQLVVGLELATVEGEGQDGEVVLRRLEASDGPTDPAKWKAAQAGAKLPVELIQDDAQFRAALVSLGSMGVIYAVTLTLVPGFYLREVRALTTWSALRPILYQEVESNEYFELVFSPIPDASGDYKVLTSKRNTVPSYEPGGHRPATMWVATTKIGRVVAAIAMEYALKNPPVRAPKNLATALKATVVDGYVDKNYEVLQLNLDVNADSTEQNVDYDEAVEAIEATLAVIKTNYEAFCTQFPPGQGNDGDRDVPFHTDPAKLLETWRAHPIPLSPLGIRFVPANDAFMSPMYQRRTCTIEMPMPGSDHLDHELATHTGPARRNNKRAQLYEAYLDGRRKLMQDLEQALALPKVGGGRPHWGQANFVGPRELLGVAPGYRAWLEQVRRYNHSGLFNGALSDRLNFSQHPRPDEPEPDPDPGSAAITGEVIFRHQRKQNRGILKVKGDLAWMIYRGLTEPTGVCCKKLAPKKCKRMGLSVVASTQNMVDPVVAEFRFSPSGAIVRRTDDFRLYHSFASNRQYGSGRFENDRLTITGDAASGLIEYCNAGRRVAGQPPLPDGPVVLRLEQLSTGLWAVESPR